MTSRLEACDTHETIDRLSIQMLYDRRGITPALQGFGCSSLQACLVGAAKRNREFWTGNWAYIGDCFGEARIGGIPARVLFVGMDRGAKERVDSETFAETQRAFRMGALKRWNPHMAGVAMVLERLLDEPDEEVRARQFALTNALKCVENTGRMRTAPTKTMIRNCSRHLEVEIQQLRPDIVVSQGAHPSATARTILTCGDPLHRFSGPRRGVSALYASKGCLLLTTPHPAARLKGLKWRKNRLPAFLEDAVYALKAAYVNRQPSNTR